MLPFYNQNEKTEDETNTSVLFNEDYDVMDFMTKDKELRELLAHPVMDTIIRKKSQKYSQIFWAYIWTFLFLYVIPSTCVYHEIFILNFIISNVLKLSYILIREYVEYAIIYRYEYFENKKAKITSEAGLTIAPILIFVLSIVNLIYPTWYVTTTIKVLTASNVLTMTICNVLPITRSIQFMTNYNASGKVLSFVLIFLCTNELYPNVQENTVIGETILIIYFALCCWLLIDCFGAYNDTSLVDCAEMYVDAAKKLRIFYVLTE